MAQTSSIKSGIISASRAPVQIWVATSTGIFGNIGSCVSAPYLSSTSFCWSCSWGASPSFQLDCPSLVGYDCNYSFSPFFVLGIIYASPASIFGASCPCSSIVAVTGCCVTKAQTMTLQPDWINIPPHTGNTSLSSSSPASVGVDPSNWLAASTSVCSFLSPCFLHASFQFSNYF